MADKQPLRVPYLNACRSIFNLPSIAITSETAISVHRLSRELATQQRNQDDKHLPW